jgi:hypothetical protein
MTDFGAWMQNNWYQLGSFFIQFAFLFAAIWFARRILRTLRASQEQVGALLKLSFFGTAPERTPEVAPSRPAEIPPPAHSAPERNSYWLPPTPSQPEPVTQFVTREDHPMFQASSGPGLIGWLKSPMRVTSGTSPFHRVLRWLQSPAHS